MTSVLRSEESMMYFAATGSYLFDIYMLYLVYIIFAKTKLSIFHIEISFFVMKKKIGKRK